MQPYTLSRDGQRPLRFDGEELIISHGSRLNGRDCNRYYSLALYAAAPYIIVHWAYRTQWQGESHHDRVEMYASPSAAAHALETFDPCAWVQGYKTILARYEGRLTEQGQYYRARQDALEATIREAYAAQVAEILTAIGCYEPLDLDHAHPTTPQRCPQCHGQGWITTTAKE